MIKKRLPLYSILPFILCFHLISNLKAEDHAKVLENHDTAFDTIQRFSREATKEYFASYYIFKKDIIGLYEINNLMDMAKRGLDVKIVLDHVGAKSLPPSLLALLERSGVEIKFFNKTKFNIFTMNRRSHMKIRFSYNEEGLPMAIVGDRNVARNYFGRASLKTNFHSVDLLSIGEKTASMRDFFLELWNSPKTHKETFKGTPFKMRYWEKRLKLAKRLQDKLYSRPSSIPLRQQCQPIGNIGFQFDEINFGMWKKPERSHVQGILDLINGAEKQIEIINPYVVLTNELKTALVQASQRGVEVSIITNSYQVSDVPVTAVGFENDAKYLLNEGIKLYEFSENPIHTKAIKVDSDKGYIGSFNLDPRSQNLNLESGAFFQDENFALKIGKIAETLKSKATPTSEILKKPKFSRCLRGLMAKLYLPFIKSVLGVAPIGFNMEDEFYDQLYNDIFAK